MAEPADRAHLATEAVDERTRALDRLDPLAAVDLVLDADAGLLDALRGARAELAAAVELIATRLAAGGRLFYVGAGTSGRLGVLDAVECRPTFLVPDELVQAVLAGGEGAMFRSVEGAEDDPDAAALELAARGLAATDVVLGITASGTTPFVHGALDHARGRGAATVFFACVPRDQAPDRADLSIRVVTGPEVLAGSTRLRAGTATKMALNLVSTLVMARLGKVHENLMVDVDTRANAKLVDRGRRLVARLVPCDAERAAGLLEAARGRVKLAVVMGARDLDRAAAEARLEAADGFLRRALEAD